VTLWLLAIGAMSILGQVVLLRELNVAFFGSELVYILALGVWLLWTAVGAVLGRRRDVPGERRLRMLFGAWAVVLPLSIVVIRGLRRIFGGVPGAYLPFPQQMLGMTLSLLPVGVILGLLFQGAAKLYVATERRSLARAYAVESAGGLAGGALATLFLKWGLQNLSACLLCALMGLVAASMPWRRGWSGRRIGGLGLLALALLAALVGGGRLDRAMTVWNHPQLVELRDTPYGRVTVTEAAGQVSVFENDALAFETEGTAAEEFVHLAALQSASFDSVLVLGGGSEGLVAEIVRYHPLLVDDVELNERLLDLVLKHLPAESREALSQAPVRVTVADPRRYLDSCPRYDLILVGMPEPTSGQTNRYYTREFFAQCVGRLTPDGVLAFRVRAAENLWTPQLLQRTASIHRALTGVFDSVVVLPGVTNIVLAGRSALTVDPAPLIARWEARGLVTRLVTGPYIRYLYTNDRFGQIERLLAQTPAAANTDAQPVCYRYTLLIWLSKFFPALGWREATGWSFAQLVRSPPVWAALLGGGALLLLCRRRPLAGLVLLVAIAGAVGMILETVLILAYQTRCGVLYQDLGLLLTMFMAGLALGAAALDRQLGVRSGDVRRPRRLGAFLLAAFAGLVVGAAWLLESARLGGLVMTSILLLACGLLVAALFAYAALRCGRKQGSVVSPLYAADLLGGCLGSLLASLALIPFMGLAGSAACLLLLVLGALVLI
jgi:spermidine synthase